MEVFIRNIVPEIIGTSSESSDDKLIKSLFFGSESYDVDNFKYTDSEKSIMMNIKNYICSVVDYIDEKGNAAANYSYFQRSLDEDTVNSKKTVGILKIASYGTFFCELENELNYSDDSSQSSDISLNHVEDNIFFQQMQTCFRPNFNVLPNGFRYTEEMKLFCIYMRILGGRLFYETFKANNVNSVPSLSAVNRYIIKSKSRYLEGHLRCEELRDYLISQNLPLIVSLSEDATRIINRPQYDALTNQIVGFVLPLNNNGMPTKMFYSADSASKIETFFYDFESSKPNEPAKYVNVIMAQPLVPGKLVY